MNFQENYLSSVIFEFHRYKTMGDKTFAQLTDEDILWTYAETDNSIAIIVMQHGENLRACFRLLELDSVSTVGTSLN